MVLRSFSLQAAVAPRNEKETIMTRTFLVTTAVTAFALVGGSLASELPEKGLDKLNARTDTDWLSQFSQGAVGPGDVQPATHIIADFLAGITKVVATLPERMVRSAGELRHGGEYDPARSGYARHRSA
jgi:hypothetical protein